jgi:tetratricopeptide (TPR) repeat protein
MKRARILGLVAAAACAASTPQGRSTSPGEVAGAGKVDLVSVSRAITTIEAAEMKGDIAAERQRRVAASRAQPADVVARFLALSAQPRDEETWNAFRAMAERTPREPWGNLGMARIYLAWGTLDQVERELGRALEVAPDNWIAILLRAQMQEKLGRTAAARDDYARVLEIDADNPDAHMGTARMLRKAGDADGAVREAKAALRAAPDLPAALVLLGTIALDRGDRRQAAEWLDRATASSPGDYEARVRLARLQGELGAWKGAVAQWRAAVAIREDAAGLRELLRAAREAGDAEAERVALDRLVLIEPGPVESWRRLAQLKTAARDAGGAEVAWARVLEKAPDDAQARLELARLSGTLALRVALDASGVATGVEVLEDTVHDGALRACAYWNLRDAAYPKKKPGRYTFRFAFRPAP